MADLIVRSGHAILSGMTWDKIASLIGIVAAVGAVWTRFIQLEARNEVTERVLVTLTAEVRDLGGQIQKLEIQLAKQGMLR